MTNVLITVGVLLASYGVYRLLRKKDDVEVGVKVDTIPEEIVEKQPEVLVQEERIQKVEETVEQMNTRLNSMKSADSEKPFATLSSASASEIPSKMLNENVAEAAPSEAKPKRKRPYKKRGPKKEIEIKKED